MTRHARYPWVVITFITMTISACYSVNAHAQIIHGQRPELTQALTFMSWKVSGDEEYSIQEWHAPVMLRAGVAENVEFAATAAVVNATGDLKFKDEQISGLTDSKVQLSASFLDDQLLVSGGVSLPTGQKKLTEEQQDLLAWLSSDFLSFPIRNTGEGLNLFGQVGTAIPLGQWVFGTSAAVYVAGAYEPYANGREYQPGSRLILNVGTERIWPANHRLTCDLLMIYTTDDKLEGRAIFRDGVQFDARVLGVAAIGKATIEGGVRYILRNKDRQPGADEDLIAEPDKRYGDDFRLHGRARIPTGNLVSAWISAEAKFLAANDYPESSPFFKDAARLTGLGGGVDFALGPRTRAGLGVRVWTGSSDGALGLGPLDLSGIEIIQQFVVNF